jgi:DNA-binding Lrp family transcriptional regulator
MDFATASRLGGLLAREQAEPMLSLLVKYRDISASEAASRLGLHIRTAQDFLEGLADLGILKREEVYEKKRPYFRYTLQTQTIELKLDLTGITGNGDEDDLTRAIRERKNAAVRFTTARTADAISAVTAWTGRGRERKEQRVNLTAAQGRFLFHLPFPTATPLPIGEIMARAAVGEEQSAEILDLVSVLDEFGALDAG